MENLQSMIDTLLANYPVESVAVSSKGTIYLSCSHPQAALEFISQHPGELTEGFCFQSDTTLLGCEFEARRHLRYFSYHLWHF